MLVLIDGDQVGQDIQVHLGAVVPLLPQQFLHHFESRIQIRVVVDRDERESPHKSQVGVRRPIPGRLDCQRSPPSLGLAATPHAPRWGHFRSRGPFRWGFVAPAVVDPASLVVLPVIHHPEVVKFTGAENHTADQDEDAIRQDTLSQIAIKRECTVVAFAPSTSSRQFRRSIDKPSQMSPESCPESYAAALSEPGRSARRRR
jgi:hypothetical protein